MDEESRSLAVKNQILHTHPHTRDQHDWKPLRVTVSFLNLAGETEVILHVPPDMRMGTVAIHAVQHLYRKERLCLGSCTSDNKATLIRVITRDGLDIGDNTLCRAWLIGSKRQGSVVPKWMLEGEHARRQQFFDQMEMTICHRDIARLVVAQTTVGEAALTDAQDPLSRFGLSHWPP